MKKTLAVVRCGDSSLHHTWMSPERNFDVGLSYFGQHPADKFQGADFIHMAVGGKWEGIYQFFEAHPEFIEAYDYFWFPDDDIMTSCSAINTIIEIAERYDLKAFQPALDSNSYYAHPITLNHRSFILRYTNFIETMVPFIDRDILKRMLPLFKKARFGFGFDYIFSQYANGSGGKAQTKAAIIDAITVQHTRPVGGALHSFAEKAGGRSAVEELSEFMAYVDEEKNSKIAGIKVPRTTVRSAITQNGSYIHGTRLAVRIGLDIAFHHRNRRAPVSKSLAFRHALKSIL